ncbi:DUF7266 family protein [Haloglomus litoreum]|uniref:DUF7266 family protein n=1 Tax=Haloglomus litoreum TaxID=3034026 RepID=UPI0023E78FE0|nr:hypothetical protein [Haloglomus sp. DT116]
MSSGPLSGPDVIDERAVSTTLGYALTLGITTLLVSGLLIVGGTFIQDQREDATRTEYRVVGQRMAADIGAADRLLATASEGGSVRVERALPDQVVGESYRMGIDRVDDTDRYRIRLRNGKESVVETVQVRSEAAVYDSGELAGDRVVIEGNAIVDEKLLVSPENEPFRYPAADENTIVVEAEAPTSVRPGTDDGAGREWVEFHDAAASGNTAITTVPNSSSGTGEGNVEDTTDGPRLDYPVEVPQSGTYCVFVRLREPPTDGDNSDSVHVGVDGNTPVTYGSDGLSVGSTETAWRWLHEVDGANEYPSVTFGSSGSHTLNLYMREDGTQVDKVALVHPTDGTCSDNEEPTGTGPEVG